MNTSAPSSLTSLPLPVRLLLIPRAEGLALVIGRALCMISRPLRMAVLAAAGDDVDRTGASLLGATLADLAGPRAEPRFAAGPVVFPPPTRCRRADMGEPQALPHDGPPGMVLASHTTRC